MKGNFNLGLFDGYRKFYLLSVFFRVSTGIEQLIVMDE